MEQWVRDIIEMHAPPHPTMPGERWTEAVTGDEVVIISGAFYGERGVSNFWRWRVIATGEERSGYGSDLTPARAAK